MPPSAPSPSTAPRKIVIAGGSGVLGLSLARHLSETGAEVTILSRTLPRPSVGTHYVSWDGRTLGGWASCLDGAAGLVNLAGRSIDCIKTPASIDEIVRSRVESTLILGRAVRQLALPPPVWVQISGLGIYGDPPDARCDEGSALGQGLAPAVGRAWEEAFAAAVPTSVRPVVVRAAMILSRTGGPLSRYKRIVRWGVGGTLGHGRQGVSWVHELDMNRIFERALTDPSMTGAYNATAPNPVSNAECMRELRRALKMPIGLPAPAFLVRLGAPLWMRTDPDLALYGRYCIPKRLQAQGFEFKFPALAAALADLCH